MDLPSGTPRRLTADSFDAMEMSPAWSPDGKWIAFTSWADNQLGHIWKVAVDGSARPDAAPQQLTKVLGEYLNTAWSPDGKTIVVTRGTGASVHGRTVAANQFYRVREGAGRGRRRESDHHA